ncbi:MAG: FmdB family transcriptional regulator [Verrucomicrobia bacterium]|nr:MAG: FmdB family transcriptional regulator [Verrucomicrobiota bacterium]
MPIYEYYCPDNNKIYQFYAKTAAQGETVPACPDNSDYQMVKRVSGFAIGSNSSKSGAEGSAHEGEPMPEAGDDPDDPRMDAAFGQLEREMESVDENDPKAMGRMMRRMSELTGENLDGEMEEVVRKLEEGQDPEKIEEEMGDVLGDPEGEDPGGYGGMGGMGAPPMRDPNLYDY